MTDENDLMNDPQEIRRLIFERTERLKELAAINQTNDILRDVYKRQAIFFAGTMDVDHNGMKFLVDTFAGPAEAHAVLRHFEPRSGYAACVCCFARSVQNFCSYK